MTLHIERIAPGSWRTTAWGKAQGLTHEIRRWDDDGGYRARISVAEIVADGPFTPMPGYRRWLAVLDPGDGLTLLGAGLSVPGTGPGDSWRGMRGAAIALDGAAAIDARVATRARVFNLIARADVTWTATWPTNGERVALPAGTTIVHAPGHAVTLTIDGGPHALATDDTLLISAASPHSLAAHAPSIVVHIA